ncbi:unnamed protein product [Lathyrus sativus]|nr:unnamed protein product [Lathyrus sativus]
MSVKLLMQDFKELSSSTGLNVNPNKCKVYFGNVEDNTKQSIKFLTGFSEGLLPFIYLGISLTSKRLSKGHYLILVEKITSRIKHWSAKLLSFAGRMQLVNSVLFATVNYWLKCFPTPKIVIKKVEVGCRSFLWSNNDKITKKSPIS